MNVESEISFTRSSTRSSNFYLAYKFIFCLLLLLGLNTAATNISACQTLSTANSSYQLNQSVSINGSTCFTISASNITLDCNGFSITGNSTSTTYGTYSTSSRPSISNCIISNFSVGIYFNNINDGRISDTLTNITNTGGNGILLSSGARHILSNITSYSTAQPSILFSSSSSNQIINSTGTSTSSAGIRLGGGSNNTISNSIGSSNSQQGIALDSSTNNNTILNSTGYSNTSVGIQLQSSSYNNIILNSIGISNSVSGATNGITIDGNNNIIYSSTAIANTSSSTGAPMSVTGNNNLIYNNTISNPSGNRRLLRVTGGNNTFYWNNFSATSALYVNDTNGTNFYNSSTEGNIWQDVINGTVDIIGSTTSSAFSSLRIGFVGTGYPYSSSTSSKVSSNVIDYHPLTPSGGVESCQNLNTSKTYYVTASFSGGSCLNITSSNMVLEGLNNQINGTISLTNVTNVTIRNLKIDPAYGLILSNTNNSVFQNISILNASIYGIWITNNSNRNNFTNVSVTTFGSGLGIQIDGGQNNSINCAGNSIVGGNVSGVYGGIYTDQSGTSIYNCNVKDFDQSIRLLASNFILNNSNVTGSSITGASFGIKIVGSVTNIVITNSRLWGKITGLGIASPGANISSMTLANNNIQGQAFALYDEGGSSANLVNSNISNNFIGNTSVYGVGFLVGAHKNNIFVNNTFFGGDTGVYLPLASSNNSFYRNNFTMSTSTYVIDNSGLNFYNSSAEGNIWQDVINGSVKISGLSSSISFPSLFIGARGIGYPYSSSTSSKVSGNVIDYHPLTPTQDFAPTISSNISVINATTGHVFFVNATANDIDGGNTLTATINISIGTCVQKSNITYGTNFTIEFNCTKLTPANASMNITFKDDANLTVITSNINNSYPNVVPTISSPSITPDLAYKTDTLTCNLGTFSDVDGDTENVSARTFKWYKNSSVISGQTSQTLSNSFFNKTDSIICEESATNSTWAGIASNNSSALNITNSVPIVIYNISFNNSTSIGHWMTLSAGVNDSDTAADIVSTNYSASIGTCTYLSNITSSNNFNVTYNCTSTYQGTSSFALGFTDNSGGYNQTPSASNGFPDHAPNLTSLSITPSNPTITSIITCNNGSFSDIDGDIENTSTRVWVWYNNGTVINSQTASTLNLQAISTSKGSNISCSENVSAQNWTNYVWNISSNVTINNSVPVAQTAIALDTTNISLYINCSVTDADRGTDITFTNLTVSSGTRTAIVNGTSGTLFWQSWNITNLNSSTDVNTTCIFKDSSNVSVNITTKFTTTGLDSYVSAAQLGSAQANSPVTWSVSYLASTPLHNCTYNFTKTNVQSNLTYVVGSDNSQQTLLNSTSVGVTWYCPYQNSPYIIYFSSAAVIDAASSVGSTFLGENSVLHQQSYNGTTPIQFLFTTTYPSNAISRYIWRCTLDNITTCDPANTSQWIAQTYTETGEFIASKTYTISSSNLVILTTFSTSLPGGGGGGGGLLNITNILPFNFPASNVTIAISGALEDFTKQGASSLRNEIYGIGIFWYIIAVCVVVIVLEVRKAKSPFSPQGISAREALAIVVAIMLFSLYGVIGYAPKTSQTTSTNSISGLIHASLLGIELYIWTGIIFILYGISKIMARKVNLKNVIIFIFGTLIIALPTILNI